MSKSLEDLTPDEVLQVARANQESAQLLDTLLGSPDTRESTLRLVKKVDPKRTIPEIDVKDAVQEETKKLRQEQDERWNKQQEKEINERIAAERARVKKDYSLSEEDMKAVEAMMIDPDMTKRIPSYDGAARVFTASRKAADPTPASLSPPVFDMPDKTKWKNGIGNPKALNDIALKEAYAVAKEVGLGRQ